MSRNEQLMIQVLESATQPLNLTEIVEAINVIDNTSLTGKTPEKSLYSIVYRREKRRREKGQTPIFTVNKRGGTQYYSVNKKAM
ncbi:MULTISPECIES: HTH domain-containing protein [Dickeya]|uniref:HTH domain-containing protein n=1 Tax=Dickeya TaxID=204037 RepID=UPI0018C92B92|nr:MULTISPECIES: HTH domain-containing protein [Dickeya]